MDNLSPPQKNCIGVKGFITAIMLVLVPFSFNATASELVNAEDIYLVTGQVYDAETGDPLAGVNIQVKGEFRGTISDSEGNFALDVEDDDVLVVSYIGFKTVEIPVNGQNNIVVELEEDTQLLDELIVVGYGVQRKEALVGAVSTVDAEQIEQVPTTSFETTLQGTVAGVQMLSNDGAPGANTQIRIRGIGSIGASSEPLYVIDGVIMTSGDLAVLNDNGNRSSNVMSGINPNDIESISVLKDAASTAIYGSRGANGVILITTKKGNTGAPRVSFKSQFGFNNVASNNLLEPLNAEQYTTLFLEGYTNAGYTQAEAQDFFDSRFTQLIDPQTGQPTDTDWLEEVTRTGYNQSFDLSISGGNEAAKYYVSTNYFDQESHIIGTDFNRLSSRANVDIKLNNRIDISNNLSLSKTDQNGMVDGSAWANPLYNAYLLSPLIPIYDETGLFNAEHQFYYPMGGNNPVGSLSGDDIRNTIQYRLTDNIRGSFRILDNLIFASNWNLDIIKVTEFQYYNDRYGNGRNSGGYAQENEVTQQSWLGTQTLNYIDSFNDVHNVEALVGFEAQEFDYKSLYAYGENFPNSKLVTLASAASAYSASATYSLSTFASYFSRVQYDYDNTYFLQTSLRRDGSSRFGANNRWGTFYSVGAGWGIHNESFAEDLEFVDQLKLRVSYGTTGNASIGNFDSRGLYGYGQDYNGNPGGAPTQIENPELTWESQENFNIAVDFGLMQMFNGTIEYFKRTSSDLLLDVPLSKTTGFDILTQNFGEMENSGLEILLNVDVINQRDLYWSVGFNTSIIDNVITKLDEAYIDGTKRRQEGNDYQSYYLYDWAGVDPSNGDPLWYTDSTRTATTNDINEAERFFTGQSATPDHYGGFNTSVNYKNFTLDAQFSYSWGNYLYDSQERFVHGDGALTPRSTTTYAFENRWTPENTDAEFPMHMWGGNNTSNVSNSTRWLHDGSYIRLRNLTIGYNVPSEAVSDYGIRSVRVYARGTNLLTFTRDSDLYIDPEQNINGLAASVTPAIRSITFGIDLDF